MEEYNIDEVQNCYNLTAKKYSDSLCNELDEKPFDRDILERFALNVDQKKPVYELASGSGHISNFLYSKGLHNIIATDITTESLDYAKTKYPHLKYSYVNMMDTELESNSVNGIVCFYGIVHFTYNEIEISIKEWNRILSKNGKALFCFHIGNGESVKVEKYFDIENAKAAWNFFEVDPIIEIMKKNGINYDEVIIRYPYIGNEHPSKRCYIQFTKK